MDFTVNLGRPLKNVLEQVLSRLLLGDIFLTAGRVKELGLNVYAQKLLLF